MRLIVKLDVKPPMVVKPVHFEGLRKIGRPEELAKKYYDQGADEIIYIDIVSSLYRRKILFDQVLEAGKNIFVPFAVGGGVRTIDDFSSLFHHGADKVVINTFAIQEDPNIIDAAARIFGSQAVVVSVEAKRQDDTWNCYTDCGRIPSKKNVLEWVSEVQDRGAGEILLQSVDMDGRQRGFDLDLIEKVTPKANVPLVVASGAGSLEQIVKVAEIFKPSGISLASLLHYNRLTIGEIKKALSDNGVGVSE